MSNAAGTDSRDISASKYALKRGELMKLISSLRSIGAQADLDLPQIVCIGNQSAGKSSLIEAISGIHVPRDSGTCTRCPMECRLSSSSEPWKAEISLRIEFDRVGNRYQETVILPFGTVNDPSDTELALRRAQMAILSIEGASVDTFRTMSEDDLRTFSESGIHLSFSKNPVCLDISGPELTELVFIDLPGIIQSAEDESLVDFVQNMVLEQIQGNSIILLTLPMIDDMDNQRAVQLRKRVDPDGLRTIGVLTKPDLLSIGAMRAREAWLDVIENRKHVLTHGYYCTRQPEDADRLAGISPQHAREQELDFFQKTVPWSNSMHKERFGTTRLTAKLSQLLSQKIDESLPKIQEDIINMLERTNQELALLPPRISDDPSTELLTLVANFATSLEKIVANGKLVQEANRSYRQFKINIRQTRPDFRMVDSKSNSTPSYIDDSDVVGDEPLPADCPLIGNPMDLQDLRSHIESVRTRELPDDVPSEAKVALMRRVTLNWEEPVAKCFGSVKESVISTLNALIARHFSRFSHLVNIIRGIVLEEVRAHEKNIHGRLRDLLKQESQPFTQNDHYFRSYKTKFQAHYKAVRRGKGRSKARSGRPAKRWRKDTGSSPAKPPSWGPGPARKAPQPATKSADIDEGEIVSDSEDDGEKEELVNEALSILAKLGYTGLEPRDLDRLIPPDKYESEIIVAAEVRAFFQVTYKRIIDAVPQMIDHQFLKTLASGMRTLLISKLDIGNRSAAQVLIQEDETIVEKREELTMKKKRLESAREELLKFGFVTPERVGSLGISV